MHSVPLVDVVGVGLNATDTLIQLEHFPARGSKVEYDTELCQPGGQVASAVVACQRWGLQTRYVGKIGDDEAAALHTRAFDEAGVEHVLVRVAGAPSPRSVILTDRDGERTVLGRRDPRLELKPSDLEQVWVTQARLLLVDGHDTAAATLAASWARAAGIPVVADLDETYPEVNDLLDCIDYPIVSRDFPMRLTGDPDLGSALKRMHRRFGCRLSAATLGQEGVLAWDGTNFCHAAAYSVPVVDTTGAGDIFHAGFLYSLLQDWSLHQQLDFACAAAAMNCTAQGARGGIRPLAEIHNLMGSTQRYIAAVA